MPRFSPATGFTLVELLVTMVIAAILMAIAVPRFQTISQRSQQTNIVGDISTMIARARSEAATARLPVTMCISSDQAACDASGSGWEAGWIVFVDEDGDQSVDATDRLLQVRDRIGGATLRISGFGGAVRALTFAQDGTLAASAAGTFRYCDTRGAASMRALVINLVGQVRTATDGDDDGTPEDHAGNELTSCA